MSFQDTIDHYNDLNAAGALERQQRLAIRQMDIAEVKRLGYYVAVLNGGVHIRIRWLDYWPSTGKWRNGQRKRHGWLKDGESLLELLKREVGEPTKERVSA